jgi:hypothetical protein
MRVYRSRAVLAVVAMLFVTTTGAVVAQEQGADPGDDHNCAGEAVSSLAGAGFGQLVSTLAQLQVVDNLGLADCGQEHRNNP